MSDYGVCRICKQGLSPSDFGRNLWFSRPYEGAHAECWMREQQEAESELTRMLLAKMILGAVSVIVVLSFLWYWWYA